MKELIDRGYIEFAGNYIHKTAMVYDNVMIGTGNIIMPYAVIGEDGFIRDRKVRNATVKIGNNNQIGCYTSILAGEHGETIIGNDNLIMHHVNVGHDVVIGNNCEICTGTIIGGHAKIDYGVQIKLGCTIRTFVKIGAASIVGMGSVVVEDVPYMEQVIGHPAQ